MYNNQWGSYGSCFANAQPDQVAEKCGDSKDNDCDGLTDEGCYTPTPTQYPTPVTASPPLPTPIPDKNCRLTGDVSIAKSTLALDTLRKIANKAASHVIRRLGRRTRSGERGRVARVINYSKNAPALCERLYTESMSMVNDMPDEFHQCFSGNCTERSYEGYHDDYAAGIKQMTRVVRKITRGYNKAVGLKSRRMVRLRRNANREKRSLTLKLAAVPKVNFSCR